jgi:serine/threonine-protein kinase
LEKEVPDCAAVLRCLVEGAFYYRKQGMPVAAVKNFAQLLKECGAEKRRIVIANLHTRLDAVPRYKKENEFRDDDIPF